MTTGRHTGTTDPLRVLRVDASGRIDGSATRTLSADLVTALEARHGSVALVQRDLADGVPLIDEAWIGANFTDPDKRSDRQRETLAFSDGLVGELQAADVIIIGVPLYNFGIPAALKAWIDMVARARLTFRYTENGPRGLLTGKKAYLVVASGGVAIGSAVDFATPYMRHALQFIGITDVEIVAAAELSRRGDDALGDARARIADLVHTQSALAASAA